MADRSRFWNRMADRYAGTPISNPEAYERKLRETQALFTPESEVLEFGCGTGSTAIAHAPHVKSIRAIDFSERMIEICREKADKAGVTNIDFELATLDDLDNETEAYDVVLGLSILHLLDNMEKALDQVFRLLKPGGYFVSSASFLTEMPLIVRMGLPIARLIGVAPPLNLFSEEELLAALKRAGFEIVTHWRPGPREAAFTIAQKPA